MLVLLEKFLIINRARYRIRTYNLSFRRRALYPVEANRASRLQEIYIGFYVKIRFNFLFFFLIYFFGSLTVQTNHLILRYKVLNLCWVPLPLKISSKLKTEVVPLLVTRSRRSRDRVIHLF